MAPDADAEAFAVEEADPATAELLGVGVDDGELGDVEVVEIDVDGRRRRGGRRMKIVLREDVETLGRKGDLVDVADGYARNYLVPRGLAMKATKGVVAQAEAMRRNRAGARGARSRPRPRSSRRARRRAAHGRGARRRGRQALRLGHRGRHRRRGARRQPGSSSTAASVVLDEPIRELGEVEVPVRLHAEVVVPLVVDRRRAVARAARTLRISDRVIAP